MNAYSGKWVQACLPAGDGMFTPLYLMSPPLELAPLPLESAPLETAQPFFSCATLEVVVSGVCEYFVLGLCEICAVLCGP